MSGSRAAPPDRAGTAGLISVQSPGHLGWSRLLQEEQAQPAVDVADGSDRPTTSHVARALAHADDPDVAAEWLLLPFMNAR